MLAPLAIFAAFGVAFGLGDAVDLNHSLNQTSEASYYYEDYIGAADCSVARQDLCPDENLLIQVDI